MKTETAGFIGGGRITRIFLQAFRNREQAFNPLLVYEPNSEVASKLKGQFPGITLASSPSEVVKQDLVFIAVHPPVIMETLDAIKESVGPDTAIVSLAPKISIAKICEKLDTDRVARMIPNATSYINKGINPVCFHESIAGTDKDNLMKLLRKMGKTMEVEESLLEGYAIASAMLPTYFWFQWKKMEEIAMQMGFSEKDAKKVIRQTLKRSINLYYKASLDSDEVMDLIPVKPIGEDEKQIEEILENRLLGLYEKIKP